MSRSQREKYQLILAVSHVFDTNYVALLTRLPSLRVTVTNLRNCPLARSHILAIFDSIPSLFYNLVTGSRAFPSIPLKAVIKVYELQAPSPVDWREMKENAASLPSMHQPAGARMTTAGSSSSLPKILIPVHPQKAELAVLRADLSNCIQTLKVDKKTVTRVISTVSCSEDGEQGNCWRVSDYGADGCMLMSVLCKFTTQTVQLAKSSGLWLRASQQEERCSTRPAPTSKHLRL